MTAFRLLALAALTLSCVSTARATPPSSIEGKYVTLTQDRLEFPNDTDGSHGDEAITYLYSTVDDFTASLTVNYPSSGRKRDVTLSFFDDGNPAGYREYDFASTDPPRPPLFRSGTFEIGDLVVLPPPPVESSAPDSLTGSFLQVGKKRFEFLTAENGRRFLPGNGDYFTYSYTILDETSAKVVLNYEDGIRSLDLLVTFDASGEPIGCTSTDSSGGEASGSFALGTNRHLGDLKIGPDPIRLLGDDYFRAIGTHQTASMSSDSTKTLDYAFEIENDGDTDSFQIRATPSGHHFRVDYFSYPQGRNLTAAMTTGRYVTTELAHRTLATFTMELTPLRANGAFLGKISARSVTVDHARDAVHSLTHVKAKSKTKTGKSRKKR